MGRLIEVRRVVDLPAELVVRVGDLLLFRATGGRVQSGAGVTNLGSFVAGALTGAMMAAYDSAPRTADTIYRALDFVDAGMPLG